MVRVGLITYHRAHNYGATLQAYALFKFLQYNGHEPVFIDYWPNYHKEVYRIFSWKLLSNFETPLCLKFKRILILLFGFWRCIRKYEKFEHFFVENLNVEVSPKYLYPALIPDQCDIYVYGSDQIWRYSDVNTYNGLFKGFEDIYFGVFPITGKKKITYAASMGVVELNLLRTKYILRNLGNFSALSVREVSLAKVLNNLSFKPEIVVDPIFLLDSQQWKDLFSLQRQDDKYILLYNLKRSDKAYQLAHFLSKLKGIKVIEITGHVRFLNFNKNVKDDCGPIDFLQLMYGAEFIVTTSFHGVAFSILFEKQFFSLDMGNNEDRVINLLQLLGVGTRYLKKVLPENYNLIPPINYRLVKNRLKLLKKKSFEYLLQNIG